MKKIKTIIYLFLGILLAPLNAWATTRTYSDEMSDFTSAAGLTYRPAEVVVGDIINAFLGFLGVIFMILIIYAGFMWMTAGGNEEKVSQAKKIISNSSIGLVVVILAYFITAFVIQTLIDSGL